MNECKIYLKIGDIEYGPFNSDKDLDGWIFDHRDTLSFNGKDITFSMKPPKQEAHDKLNEGIVRALDFQSGSVIPDLKRNAVYSTPVNFLKYGGIAKDVNGRTLWINPIYPLNKTPKTVDTKEFLDLKMDIGHDFDAMMEFCLKKTNAINTKVLKKDSDQYKSMFSVAQATADKIMHDHPNAMFLTQKYLAAKEITSAFQESMRLALSGADSTFYKGGDVNEINSFLGQPDLIVIDDDGSVSVYDFKTSEGNVTVENHREYALQIACYAQMCKQYGLTLKNVALIPVNVRYVNRDANQKQHCIASKNGFTLNSFSYLSKEDKA